MWAQMASSWKKLRYRDPEKLTSHTLKYEENVRRGSRGW